MTPAERTLRAKIGAYSLHAKYDSRDLTAPGRTASLERFEREVDPDGVLDPVERQRRAEAAKKAYFTKLALKSARRRKKHKAQ